MHPFIAPPRLHGTLYSPEELVRYCQLTLPEDSRGFELLVSQYKGLVFKTVFRLMGNRDDAGDQAQEVFVKIYRGIKQIDVPLTFPTWIYCITVITCPDALRKKKRHPVQPLESATNYPEDETSAIEIPDTRAPTPVTKPNSQRRLPSINHLRIHNPLLV